MRATHLRRLTGLVAAALPWLAAGTANAQACCGPQCCQPQPCCTPACCPQGCGCCVCDREASTQTVVAIAGVQPAAQTVPQSVFGQAPALWPAFEMPLLQNALTEDLGYPAPNASPKALHLALVETTLLLR
jgi:hypothetical protein